MLVNCNILLMVNIMSLTRSVIYLLAEFLFQSKHGTYVNESKIVANVEKEIFENNLIGLGVNPITADRSKRSNFIYMLKKAETLEIYSDEE